MFTSGTQIAISLAEPGMKIYLNSKWWTILNITLNNKNEYELDIESKFNGSAKIDMPSDSIIFVEKYNTLGHKHQHLTYNDSSQPKEQDKKIPGVVYTGWGMGSG